MTDAYVVTKQKPKSKMFANHKKNAIRKTKTDGLNSARNHLVKRQWTTEKLVFIDDINRNNVHITSVNVISSKNFCPVKSKIANSKIYYKLNEINYVKN